MLPAGHQWHRELLPWLIASKRVPNMNTLDLDVSLTNLSDSMRELEEELDTLEGPLEGRGPAPDAETPEAQEWRARMLKGISALEATSRASL